MVAQDREEWKGSLRKPRLRVESWSRLSTVNCCNTPFVCRRGKHVYPYSMDLTTECFDILLLKMVVLMECTKYTDVAALRDVEVDIE